MWQQLVWIFILLGSVLCDKDPNAVAAQDSTKSAAHAATTSLTTTTTVNSNAIQSNSSALPTNSSSLNDCSTFRNCTLKASLFNMYNKNKDRIKRTFYVAVGITGIVLVYFAVRTIRLHRNRKVRKYGVIATKDDRLEMQPLELDDDDDDEESTLFERNSKTMQEKLK